MNNYTPEAIMERFREKFSYIDYHVDEGAYITGNNPKYNKQGYISTESKLDLSDIEEHFLQELSTYKDWLDKEFEKKKFPGETDAEINYNLGVEVAQSIVRGEHE